VLRKFSACERCDDKIARTRPLVERAQFLTGASGSSPVSRIQQSVAYSVKVADIETLMPRRPIDRLANANVVGVPTAAASNIVSKQTIFSMFAFPRESPRGHQFITQPRSTCLTLITVKIIFLFRNDVSFAANRFPPPPCAPWVYVPFFLRSSLQYSTTYRAATYRPELQLSPVAL